MLVFSTCIIFSRWKPVCLALIYSGLRYFDHSVRFSFLFLSSLLTLLDELNQTVPSELHRYSENQRDTSGKVRQQKCMCELKESDSFFADL